MRWVTCARASRFPADMLQRLELLGRFELDPRTSGIDSGEIWPTCVAPFWEDANADRDGFLTDLHALVATEHGGFETFGAARLVWELLGGEALRTPAALPLIDGGIEFKRARGLPNASLTDYEMQRLYQLRDADG
jgi:hypothetical protein